MKLLWLALALLLTFTSPTWAAIGTPVNLGCAQASSGTSLTITTTNAIATGDLVVLVHTNSAANHPITALVDSGAANTYYSALSEEPGSVGIEVWFASNAVALAAGQTITASFTSSVHGICAFKVAGMETDHTLVVDKTPATQRGQTTSVTATTISTGTLAQANELLVAIAGANVNWLTGPTPAAGFNQISATSNVERNTVYTQTVASTASVDWSYTGTFGSSQFWGSGLVSFKAASGGGSVTYYVSPTGSDAANGLTTGTAFLTIAHAAALTNPGDSVEIMAGTYGTFHITRSGTAGNPITYENYLNDTVTINQTGAAFAGIQFDSPGADYITIDHLHVIGNSQSLDFATADAGAPGNNLTNGRCITVSGGSHHVIISNNEMAWCPGAGLVIGGDYNSIFGNTIHNNSYWASDAESGVTMIGTSIDSSDAAKIFFYNNILYGNQNFICNKPQTSPCAITDGEGIIVDSNKATWLHGRIQIYNNIAYTNGGAGIQVLNSQKVDVFNNTLYNDNRSANETDPKYISHTSGGETKITGSTDVNVENNIEYGNPSVPMIYTGTSGNVSLTWDYNILFAGTGAAAIGVHDLVADPRFVDVAIPNFHLQPCASPASNSGTTALTSIVDFAGTSRGSAPSRGAYQ